MVARATRIGLSDALLASSRGRKPGGSGHAIAATHRHDRLLGLQVLRGLAALLVVVHHVALTLALPKYMGLVIAGGLFVPLGRAGVDLFFVLSGFIIYYVHHVDIGMPASFRRYAMRRLVRIYPTYWAVLLPVVGALFILPSLGTGADREPVVILKSALLIPFSDRQPLIGVAWTLSHELLFYALFGVAILSGRLGPKLFAVWLISLILARLLPRLPPPLDFLLHVKNLEFFFGMAVARLLLSDRLHPGWGTLLAGAAGFLAVGIVERGRFDFQLATPTLFYGVAAAVMTFALAALERRGHLPTVPRLLILLGAASYSIYLIHYAVVVGAIKLAHATTLTDVAGLALFPLVAVLAVAAGLSLHAIVERPVLRMATGRHDVLPMAAAPTMNPRQQHL